MGISSNAARFLMERANKRPFSGSLLTLGVQDLSFDIAKLRECALAAGLNTHKLPAYASLPQNQRATDKMLFDILGFDEVVRGDFSDFEGAELLFDLNSADGPPAEYRSRFDCVIDGGTMEHVFHVPNALKNIFEFMKVGGRIIHMSPTNNYVDHGFYSFSPTLFHDFYEENGFAIDKIHFIRHERKSEKGEWIVGEYSPGALDHVSYGGLDDGMYATFFIATKTAQSTAHRIPQQSLYKKQWAGPIQKPDKPRLTLGQKLAKRANRFLGRQPRTERARFPIKPISGY